MAFLAYPPCFFVGFRKNVLRRKRCILRRMPFSGNRWVNRLKAVFFRRISAGAKRATFPVINGNPPFMPLLAKPPYFFTAMGGHILRRQRQIPGRMPIIGNQRFHGQEAIVFSDFFPHAIRTPFTPASIV